jgi:phage tail sheath protein FI
MPVALSYPGVYLQELPSGVRTITGVATSIAAFVGGTARGPVNTPVTITSYADFERIFGGLWVNSRLGYAVRDFYQNGGTTAIIVRVVHSTDADPSKNAAKAAIPLPGGPPTLLAANEGSWGNALHAVVDNQVSADMATQFGLAKGDLFNLSVRDFNTGVTEVYRNLTVKDSPRRIDRVLPVESTLVQSTGALTAVPTPNNPPAQGKTIWTDPNANTAATANSGIDGGALVENDFAGQNFDANKQGLYALRNASLFNILCIPPYNANGDVETDLIGKAAAFCEERRAMLLVDPPSAWTSVAAALTAATGSGGLQQALGTNSKNAAVFFPRIMEADPLHNNNQDVFVPSGAVAGIFARTDAQRGVWKAPAGIDATLSGVSQLAVTMTDLENGELNPVGINCLRSFPAAGRVVWGARTLQGDDSLASQWKYIPIRRLALFIEESLFRGTQWVVFEPNDAPLWAQIRLNVGAFMQTLFRQGAFQGSSPQQAYFVKCDSETTTPTDQNNGIVNIVVGFAPLKPAEFVVIMIQQMAGQTAA